MKFGHRPHTDCHRARGFTLAEVLAALAFMAIVIPVAVEGIRTAGLAGQVSRRKSDALRVAENALNEWIIAGPATGLGQQSVVRDGFYQYHAVVRTEPWSLDAMQQVSVEVTYYVQNREFQVFLDTLIDDDR